MEKEDLKATRIKEEVLSDNEDIEFMDDATKVEADSNFDQGCLFRAIKVEADSNCEQGGLFRAKVEEDSNSERGGLFRAKVDENSNSEQGGLFRANVQEDGKSERGGLFRAKVEENSNSEQGGLFRAIKIEEDSNCEAGGLFRAVKVEEASNWERGGLFRDSEKNSVKGEDKRNSEPHLHEVPRYPSRTYSKFEDPGPTKKFSNQPLESAMEDSIPSGSTSNPASDSAMEDSAPSGSTNNPSSGCQKETDASEDSDEYEIVKLIVEGVEDDPNEPSVIMTSEEVQSYLVGKIHEYMNDPKVNPILCLKLEALKLEESVKERTEELKKIRKMYEVMFRNQERFLRHIGSMPKLSTNEVGVGVDWPLLPNSIPKLSKDYDAKSESSKENQASGSASNPLNSTNNTSDKNSGVPTRQIECIDLTDDTESSDDSDVVVDDSGKNAGENLKMANANSAAAHRRAAMASGRPAVASGRPALASGKPAVTSGKAAVANGKPAVVSGRYTAASGRTSGANGRVTGTSGRPTGYRGRGAGASGRAAGVNGRAAGVSARTTRGSGRARAVNGRAGGASGRQTVITGKPSFASGSSSTASNSSAAASKSGSFAFSVPVAEPAKFSYRCMMKHPAPLPPRIYETRVEELFVAPTKPVLKISADCHGITLQWDMPQPPPNKLASFEIFGYQEHEDTPAISSLWKKIGSVKALNLPMACTLTQFVAGFKYHFSIRAVDIYGRCGMYSDPASIVFLPEQAEAQVQAKAQTMVFFSPVN